ncbi:Hypothetical predicted protein [Mytilus galloprovincialis]|uniref:Exportin-4 n=1 Tax=Mytilus galloprovincialis TaxID=29158 RepID=A0A8B6HLR9_MYTGA|nr:Hypothetical predicted protein [Mytilus galloprovincialis]
MAEKITQELEHASQIVLAAPNIVTPEQRIAAEHVILEFRKTKLPYNICKYILENSKCDYVLFQAATTIKESVIREWALLEATDIEALRSFLLHFITQHILLQSYAREQILQTVAVILKRGTIDIKGASCDSLFQDVTNLVVSGNVTMQLVACSMLTALLNEYSSSSRTSSVGFTWEFHAKCKRAFEEKDLKRVFQFALQVMNELERQPEPITREATAVLNRLLSISEHVLCWEFTPKVFRRHIGSFEMNQNVPLKPNKNWRDTLLDKSVVELFFKIYKRVRYNSDMANHCLQCISQLASLNGPVFPDDKSKCQYLAFLLGAFLPMLASIELQDFENLGIANTFKNVVNTFSAATFMSIPSEMMESFLHNLTHQTCTMGRSATMEEALHKDDTVYMEAYEYMLESWMELVNKMKDISVDSLKPKAIEVFNTYIQCHISGPEGTRTQDGMDAALEDSDVDEIEEDDRERFGDVLCCIGTLARMVPYHSIPLLSKILEDRISRLHGQLQRLQQFAAEGHDVSMDTSYLTVLYEDLHWIILVATNVLTIESEGETPMIPPDIMEYTISTSKDVNIDTTLKVLSSPNERIDSIPGAEQHTDGVVRLVSGVFRLCEVERRAVDAKLTGYISPQLISTTMWFLHRWSRSYLLPDENYYTHVPSNLTSKSMSDSHEQWVSHALLSSFGRDADGAQWVISFLFNCIMCNLNAWTSEDNVLKDSLDLLVSLVENKSKAEYVTKCEHLWTLAKEEANHQPPYNCLPSHSRRCLIRALVLAGSGVKDETWKEQYWNCILGSLHDRFYKVVCQENFSKLYCTGGVKTQVIDLLESVRGVALGTRVDNLNRIFDFLHPLLQECVKILDVYHNYEDVVPLVLELYSEVIQKQLCFLGEAKSRKLYELSLSVIETYSNNIKGKHVLSNRYDEDQEDKYNDILIVMELLTNLLSKDFIDFGEDNENINPEGGHVKAADVALYGLHTIIPLMNADLLKFPNLCTQYFKLVSLLAESDAEKFVHLPDDLLKSLTSSVELGLSSYGSDTTSLCLEILSSLTMHICQNNLQGSKMYQSICPFMKFVFSMLLIETFNMELLDSASSCLFCLICCYQNEYREYVNHLLEGQREPAYKQRMLEAFNKLTPPTLNMTVNRESRIKFMESFNEFMINVRGFLCVK